MKNLIFGGVAKRIAVVTLAVGSVVGLGAAPASADVFDNGQVTCWSANSGVGSWVSVKPPDAYIGDWTGLVAYTFDVRVYDGAGRLIRSIPFANANGSRAYLWADPSFYGRFAAAQSGSRWYLDSSLAKPLRYYPSYDVGVGRKVMVYVQLWNAGRWIQQGYAVNRDPNGGSNYCYTNVRYLSVY